MKIGFAFCGSFCNHPELLKLYEDIAREHAGETVVVDGGSVMH